jgi:hypothetical protein
MKAIFIYLLKGVLMLVGIILIIFINFHLSQPPAIVSANAPGNVFSAERAAEHLSQIALKPNPIGSKANEEVRQYITAQIENMSLTPVLHVKEYFNIAGFYPQCAATVRNILVRIPGHNSEKAVLFMGHYDTRTNAPGASDNKSAVVTMLEVIRMLAHYPQKKNDLIFLFTDGEEYGLFGASAFLDDHPWATDVDVVINLEAMGTSGMSQLFETGDNNLSLIREFGRTVPYPAGNSLSYEIYKIMPNSTDYEVFKKRGIQGLNFAYVGNTFDYHTPGDNIENTDLRSIQHHGSYVSALALHLGNIDLDSEAKENAVYFNTLGTHFIWYPYSWARVFVILVLVIAVSVIIIGTIRKKIRLWKLLIGLISYLVFLLLLYALADAAYQILANYYRGENFRLIDYNQRNILLGVALISASFSAVYFYFMKQGVKFWQPMTLFLLVMSVLWWSGGLTLLKVAIALLIAVYLYFTHRKPMQMQEVFAGALLVWVVLMGVAGFMLTGVSHLFTWPLLFSLIPFAYFLTRKSDDDERIFVVLILLIFAAPVLVLFPLIMNSIQIAMGVSMMYIPILMGGLMLGLLVPHFLLMTRRVPWLFPGLTLVAGLIVLLTSTIRLEFDNRHKKHNSIVHVTEISKGESFLFTISPQTDEWTSLIITEKPDTLSLNRFYPLSKLRVPAIRTTGISPDPALIEILSDSIDGGERILKMLVKCRQHSTLLDFYFDTGEGETSIRVGGLEKHHLLRHENTSIRSMRYFAPPEDGVVITLYTPPGETIKLQLNEVDFEDIPQLTNYPPRPDHMMDGGDRRMIVSRYEF